MKFSLSNLEKFFASSDIDFLLGLLKNFPLRFADAI